MASYKSLCFGVLLKEQGVKGFFKGWAPTLLGYNGKHAFKYDFYEFFKKYYSNIVGPEYVVKYKTSIYLVCFCLIYC
ncbi:Mitochondrial phosphate carrier protein 3, mitochondrial [Dendrobium catenatum]|uniref:Mitochondrial phosphate carrier protein 3, mitochondrial n=1 Tax=Dendrobium catenatum TaxID=906689 RepID=A0A2I0XJK5_9ASPA|nr:Mitochondrial phosphate carrier protein 3, mitochondrial [Dendrobium catenatum]